MARRFRQLDVFAPEPYQGNPLAVVVDADGLTTDEMRTIARWTNLSETTFLLPPTTPDADYRVRIFSMAEELSFAGHPTLGACHAWLASGGVPRDPTTVVQECGAGLVPVRRDAAGLAFAAPPLVRSGRVDDATSTMVAAVLGLDPADIVDLAWVDNGPGWIGVLLADADAVLAVEPDVTVLDEDGWVAIGVVGPHPPGGEVAFEVRGLFTDGPGSLREDPVTGSLNASLAQWLLGSGRATAPYVAAQGTRLDRAGRPRVTQDADGTIWIGGPVHTCIAGTIEA